MQRRTRLGLTGALLFIAAFSGGLRAAPDTGGAATLISVSRLSSDDPRFGGFSAIEVSADGREILLVSDRGTWTEGFIDRDKNGAIEAVSLRPLALLKGTGDAPLQKRRADSEGIARAPDGTVYISFEGAARVLRYKSIAGSAENLPSHPDFATFHRNAALEALAIDETGALYTLPEDTRQKGADFPLYRFANGAWSQKIMVPRQGEFLPVGADFGPDQRLYLLERAFYGLGGFASRVRALTLSETAVLQDEVVLQTPAGRHDNVEGISVWRDQNGAIRLTLVSDDNHVFYLRNQLLEYRLPPDPR